MTDTPVRADTLAAIAAGDEALDRGDQPPTAAIALLSADGALVGPLPVAQGGRGWGTSADGALPMLALLTALGGASLAIARIYEGHVNAIKLVVRHGNDAQRERIAAAVRGGALMGVWGAERDRPVTIDAASHTLVGVKTFASGLGDVTDAVVIARADDGLRMALVDARDSARGDTGDWDVDAMVGSRSGRFDCTGLPADTITCLGAPEALFVEPDFQGGLWRLAACYAGAMDMLARATTERVDRTDPLVAHRIGLLALEAETAAMWAHTACVAVETPGTNADAAATRALFAREAVDQGAARLLALVERMNGTAMHRRGSAIGRRSRDLRLYLRQADVDGKLRTAVDHWIAGRR